MPQGDIIMENKQGWQTTEFWMALAGNIIGLLVLTGVFQNENSAAINSNINEYGSVPDC